MSYKSRSWETQCWTLKSDVWSRIFTGDFSAVIYYLQGSSVFYNIKSVKYKFHCSPLLVSSCYLLYDHTGVYWGETELQTWRKANQFLCPTSIIIEASDEIITLTAFWEHIQNVHPPSQPFISRDHPKSKMPRKY